jgi:hypothetical protein
MPFPEGYPFHSFSSDTIEPAMFSTLVSFLEIAIHLQLVISIIALLERNWFCIGKTYCGRGQLFNAR